MNLTPREKDKLLIAVAAMVARQRLQRGVKLNYPEAIALICDFVTEGEVCHRAVIYPPGGVTPGAGASPQRTGCQSITGPKASWSPSSPP